MSADKKQEIALRDKTHLLADVAVAPPEGAYGYQAALAAAGVEVLEFEEFGSYQGDWWAKVRFPNGEVYFVTGDYGSCSGRAEREWQPIETAPKDGREFIAGRFAPEGDKSQPNNLVAVDRWHKMPEDGYTGLGQFNNQYWPATHWMPLPAPPAKENDNER